MHTSGQRIGAIQHQLLIDSFETPHLAAFTDHVRLKGRRVQAAPLHAVSVCTGRRTQGSGCAAAGQEDLPYYTLLDIRCLTSDAAWHQTLDIRRCLTSDAAWHQLMQLSGTEGMQLPSPRKRLCTDPSFCTLRGELAAGPCSLAQTQHTQAAGVSLARWCSCCGASPARGQFAIEPAMCFITRPGGAVGSACEHVWYAYWRHLHARTRSGQGPHTDTHLRT